MYQNDAMKVLTGEVRLSYANLTTPRAAQQGGEPKYSVTLLIPKSDAATKADIDAAIQAAANDALAKVWNGARPPMLKVPIYDGDGVRPSGVPFGDECKGHWVMTASTKNKPQVVGIDNINCELSPGGHLQRHVWPCHRPFLRLLQQRQQGHWLRSGQCSQDP